MYFVSSRTYSVKINSSLSPTYFNIHGVPQGYVSGLILFIIYILPTKLSFHKYANINYHLYVFDLHIYTYPPSYSSSDYGLNHISINLYV